MKKNHKLTTVHSFILTLYFLASHASLTYAAALIIPYLPYSALSTIISLLLIVFDQQPFTVFKIFALIGVILALLCMRDNRVIPENGRQKSFDFWVQKKYLIPIYFICFSFESITTVNLFKIITLCCLFVMLLMNFLKKVRWLPYFIETVCILNIFWIFYSYFKIYGINHRFTFTIPNDKIWFYINISSSILLGKILIYAMKEETVVIIEEKQKDEEIEIEMKDLSKKISEESITQEKEEKKQEISTKKQTDILNFFLVIPFILSENKLFQAPIYLYVVFLQFNFAPIWSFYLMLITVFYIAFQSNYSTQFQLLLRLCLVLIVDKNIQLAVNITKIVRSILLRISFLLVLSVLFWFALKTVNIFHIGLIILLMLFITRNSKSERHQRSYRNRNWKYLQLIFQAFLLLRFCWEVSQQFGIVKPQQVKNVLRIVGISFKYTQSFYTFNFIPFFISGIIAVQYWIYSSHIYRIQTKQSLDLLPAYRLFLQKLLNILTICYYKIIPWSSHIFTLIILISLEFSITSGLILLWALAILLTHMVNGNNPQTYEKLYSMWLICSRLIAAQIILRYLFEFMKFPIIYRSIEEWPIMDELLKYQQILGLLIRQSENSYWSNVFTKFQLMIALDFILIAITFLALEYYHILIKYSQRNELYSNESQAIVEVYEKYIDFKLTEWLKNFNQILVICSTIFLKIYFPIIGIFCCFYFAYSTLIYMLLCVIYYLAINQHFFHAYIVGKMQSKISQMFEKWRTINLPPQTQIKIDKSSENEESSESQSQLNLELKEIKEKLVYTIPYNMQKNQIYIHQTLRVFVVFFTLIFIVLNYSSRLFATQEVYHLISVENVHKFRWILLVSGTSYQSDIGIGIYLLIIVLTVLQIKCCSLLNKQEERPENFSEQMIERSESSQRQVCSERQSFLESAHKLNQEKRSGQKFVDMEVTFRLGVNKMLQRGFVILLVFVSILQDNDPFSIVYLCCAWLLSSMGSHSIQALSRTLGILIMFEYSLVVTNTNINPHYKQKFPNYVSDSWLVTNLNIEDKQWKNYLCFGDSLYQLYVIFLSFIILMLYQLCFYIEKYSWLKILYRLEVGVKLGRIQFKIYEHLCRIYEYALVYSPLCITTLCLALYLMDYTATNMFLATLSVIFLFKSFLLERYTESRPFWKSYFRILQVLIILFMVIYCVLTTPMYKVYCNKLLCSSQEFSTKVTKTILLLILQIGIDLISSRHFIAAMAMLKVSLESTSPFYRLAISYMQNDRRIERKFRLIDKKAKIKSNLQKVQNFLSFYKENQNCEFQNKKDIIEQKQSWLDTVLELLPSLVDAQLIMTPQQCKIFIRKENEKFIEWVEKEKKGELSEKQLKKINQIYIDTFGQLQTLNEVRQKINEVRISRKKSNQKEEEKNLRRCWTAEKDDGIYRKSYVDGILPFEKNQICKEIIETEIIPQRKSQVLASPEKRESRKTVEEYISLVNKQEKKKLLYLLIFQSILSNWHYLTYILMIMEFIFNMGLLTLTFPFIVFIYGLPYTYQAPKWVWRLAFISILFPTFFKFSIAIGLFSVEKYLQFLLIGDNLNSIFLQYCLIFFILIQCLILKIVGLYDYSTPEVQCMRMALIRNIVNCNNENQKEKQEKRAFYMMLQESEELSESYFQFLFSKRQCKYGYDYSTLMVSVQLMILVYIFCFYDKMAIQNELTFYEMIEYNQFNTGMVIMAFIQLVFILIERVLNVTQFSQKKWDLTLIIKYFILLISLIFVHSVTILFFPFNSGNYTSNTYITIFYILYSFYFLISALQIRFGIQKQSKGFMDRYTWYNGFIYMTYRAIPFLFEFKVFSDWTFTNTSLRLFDWIKFEQIFGRLYVAKCNSLFLQGKILGSKIEWWKKLSMGFPLLFAIILLLFGPLILFSNLNPLSAVNLVSGGYIDLSLRINKTNEYPLYTNSHIIDIHIIGDKIDKQTQKIIKDYELDKNSIQEIFLEDFSDQYWEISEGSFSRLMDEPEDSLYELRMKIKFQRNLTGATPVYKLSNYTIPKGQISSFKETLNGKKNFQIKDFFPKFMRLDNNNGLHFLSDEKLDIKFHAEQGKKRKKNYWIINDGINFRLVSDKYSKAIFGYSVMSFYISIILVVANYFRFLFQGSAHTIIMSDIPYADPMLVICDAVHQARIRNDLKEEEKLFWMLIDIVRSPDTIKALTGNYLQARLQTLQRKEE